MQSCNCARFDIKSDADGVTGPSLIMLLVLAGREPAAQGSVIQVGVDVIAADQSGEHIAGRLVRLVIVERSARRKAQWPNTW